MTDDVREALIALAHLWAGRVRTGPYCSLEQKVQAQAYDDCSDELLELVHNHTN